MHFFNTLSTTLCVFFPIDSIDDYYYYYDEDFKRPAEGVNFFCFYLPGSPAIFMIPLTLFPRIPFYMGDNKIGFGLVGYSL